MTQFSAASTTRDVIQGIDLSGKQAVVTGASSGLGIETARTLASAGAAVLLLARNARSLEEAVAQVRADQPNAQLDTVLLDLADLDSVRAGAAQVLAKCPRIDLLINNAGVMACPLMRTAQGFEMQFGTNHLGHFLLTALLAPALVAGAPARVINLSSGAHQLACTNLDDPNYQQRDYDNWQSYGESKTANALFSVALDAHGRASGVRSFSVHPGVIMTGLSRHLREEDYEMLASQVPEGQEMTFKSVEQGAATSIWAATSVDPADNGGAYLEDCQVAQPCAPGKGGGVESYALDPATAEQLWQLSEQMVGEPFKF